MKRFLNCFKMNPQGHIIIKFHTANQISGTDDMKTLESKEEPEDSLLAAFQDLMPIAIGMAELPKTFKESCTMRSLSISYSKNCEGYNLTVLRDLKNSDQPLSITAPNKKKNHEKEELDVRDMLDKDIDVIDKFVEHVWRYVDGKRKQITLFPEGSLAAEA